MTPERSFQSNHAFIFRPAGASRLLEAAFLSLWLAAWAAGELGALVVLGLGIASLLTGRPVMGMAEPLRPAPALGVGLFLLVWLALWTLGGVMAIRGLLRSVWAEHRLVLEPDALVRVHRYGPIAFTRRLPRKAIRRVFLSPQSSALTALVNADAVELTDLGRLDERRAAEERLRAALGLPEHAASDPPPGLPEEWRQAVGERGEPLLVPDPRTRRRQAVAMAVISGIVWGALILLAAESVGDPDLWALTAMLSVPGLWLVRQTLWLHRGRMEWRIAAGRLVYQRRFGSRVTERLEARALELIENSDSDGTTYELKATRLSPPASPRPTDPPRSVTIDRTSSDPVPLGCLGRWLSRQAGIPFHDRVPDEAARQAELAHLKARLRSTGRFGRFIARLLDRRSGG